MPAEIIEISDSDDFASQRCDFASQRYTKIIELGDSSSDSEESTAAVIPARRPRPRTKRPADKKPRISKSPVKIEQRKPSNGSRILRILDIAMERYERNEARKNQDALVASASGAERSSADHQLPQETRTGYSLAASASDAGLRTGPQPLIPSTPVDDHEMTGRASPPPPNQLANTSNVAEASQVMGEGPTEDERMAGPPYTFGILSPDGSLVEKCFDITAHGGRYLDLSRRYALVDITDIFQNARLEVDENGIVPLWALVKAAVSRVVGEGDQN